MIDIMGARWGPAGWDTLCIMKEDASLPETMTFEPRSLQEGGPEHGWGMPFQDFKELKSKCTQMQKVFSPLVLPCSWSSKALPSAIGLLGRATPGKQVLSMQ